MAFPKEMRREIRRTAGGTCPDCGRRYSTKPKRNKEEKDWPTVDHIKPESEGGQHIKANAKVRCRRCHEARHSQ